MDNFITDQQTMDELNLLGKFRPSSIFQLFNRTRTSGGERLLENMLQHPFREAEPITERAAVLTFFQSHEIGFPFDGAAVESWSDWLHTEQTSNFASSLFLAFNKKFRQISIKDERYQLSIQGLLQTSGILIILQTFVENIKPGLSVAPACFVNQVKRVDRILGDKRLLPFYDLTQERSVSPVRLAQLSYLLKGALEKEVLTLLAFIYEIDVYCAVGEVARKRSFSAATVATASNYLRVKNLKHPALAKGVGNDLELSADNNLLFLTGANMAGKSTIMKSVAIALYLAHAGFPVAATEMEFSIKDGIYTSINVSDNVQMGYSHFYAEVLRVKNAAKLVASGKNMLVIFDELFKGTNVKDAYEGTLEVCQAFAGYTKSHFIVSTHIIEVGDTLAKKSNVSTYYMPTIMEGSTPVYTYKLTKGITKDRQGMLIILNEGILDLLKQSAF